MVKMPSVSIGQTKPALNYSCMSLGGLRGQVGGTFRGFIDHNLLGRISRQSGSIVVVFATQGNGKHVLTHLQSIKRGNSGLYEELWLRFVNVFATALFAPQYPIGPGSRALHVSQSSNSSGNGTDPIRMTRTWSRAGPYPPLVVD